MFLKNSRYYSLPQVEVTLPDGRTVNAVKLRAHVGAKDDRLRLDYKYDGAIAYVSMRY